jgi:hypothetical protein
MNAKQILSLIPNELLSELAISSGVNKYSKKLQGELIFKLLIYCIITYKDNSLRRMESAYESVGFAFLNSKMSSKKVRYSSISERMSSIDPVFFKTLYYRCVDIYGEMLASKNERPTTLLFDSTIVALTSKLLKVGYHLKGGDAAHLHQLKFTVGFNIIPTIADLYIDQQYTSENAALKETILASQCLKENPIRIFDRGITARRTYDQLANSQTPFVTRLTPTGKRIELTPNSLQSTIETPTLLIVEDNIIRLFNEKSERTKHVFRCVKCVQKETNLPIHFLTNIFDISSLEVTELYKQRWQIEVFFKFLKQELNFSHLINRSEKGIESMLYVTMIAAILILVYKKLNNQKGYKITKQKFEQELEKWLLFDFVRLTEGDLEKAAILLNINTS